MQLIHIRTSLCLLSITTITQSHAAEVRVCNTSAVVFNNIEVAYWKYRKLNSGECSEYYHDPLAQEYVTIGLNIDGKRLGYRSKGTPLLLGEGKYSYQVSLLDGHLQLQTVKD